MAGLPKLKEDKNLGVIVKKHTSGIRETKDGHKCHDGEVGDTLMMGTNRKIYIVPAAEMKERIKAPKEKKEPVTGEPGAADGSENGAAE